VTALLIVPGFLQIEKEADTYQKNFILFYSFISIINHNFSVLCFIIVEIFVRHHSCYGKAHRVSGQCGAKNGRMKIS